MDSESPIQEESGQEFQSDYSALFGAALQAPQEGQEFIIGSITPGRALGHFGIGQDLFLQCQVCVQIHLSGFN